MLRDDRDVAGCVDGLATASRIAEIGDARFLGAGRRIDATGGTCWRHSWPAPAAMRPAAGSMRRVSPASRRLGVGTVRWIVKPRRLEAARRYAEGLAGASRARVEVVRAPAGEPWLRLDGPPATPRSPALADILVALLGERRRAEATGLSAAELLDRLWATGDKRPAWPHLGRGRPASFLLVSPAPEGRIDAAAAALVSVWLDGVEILPGP